MRAIIANIHSHQLLQPQWHNSLRLMAFILSTMQALFLSHISVSWQNEPALFTMSL